MLFGRLRCCHFAVAYILLYLFPFPCCWRVIAAAWGLHHQAIAFVHRGQELGGDGLLCAARADNS